VGQIWCIENRHELELKSGLLFELVGHFPPLHFTSLYLSSPSFTSPYLYPNLMLRLLRRLAAEAQKWYQDLLEHEPCFFNEIIAPKAMISLKKHGSQSPSGKRLLDEECVIAIGAGEGRTPKSIKSIATGFPSSQLLPDTHQVNCYLIQGLQSDD